MAGTKTTSRSDRSDLRRALGLSLIVLGVACSRQHAEERRAPEPPQVVATPEHLLAEGTLEAPDQALDLLRSTPTSSLRALPRTYGVAVAVAFDLSPLVAGLVEDAPPVPFAVAEAEGALGFAAVLRLTSGRELLAALAHGATAAFTAEPSAVAGLTFLRRKRDPSRFRLAVFRDALVVGNTDAHVAALGPFLTEKPRVVPSPSDALVRLSVEPEALRGRNGTVGPVPSAFRAAWAETLRELLAQDESLRSRHGGRAPDFGEPKAVVAAMSEILDEATRVVESASGARLVATREPEGVRIRVEVTPLDTGAARDAIGGLVVGSASALLRLPASTQMALLARQMPISSVARRVSDVLGERLSAANRSTLGAWASGLTTAMGDTYSAGLYASAAGHGAFLQTDRVDAVALRRSVTDLPALLSIRGISAPLEARFGRLRVQRSAVPVSVPGAASAVSIRIAADASGEAPVDLRALAVSAEARGGLVIGTGVEAEGASLIRPDSATLAADGALSRAVTRARDEVAAAAVLGAGADDLPQRIVALVGKNQRELWCEVTVPAAAISSIAGLGARP